MFHSHPDNVKHSKLVETTNGVWTMPSIRLAGTIPSRTCQDCGNSFPATTDYFDGSDNSDLDVLCLVCRADAIERGDDPRKDCDMDEVLKRIEERHDRETARAAKRAYNNLKRYNGSSSLRNGRQNE